MVRVGGMDPDKRQEMVETESMINRNVKGGGVTLIKEKKW